MSAAGAGPGRFGVIPPRRRDERPIPSPHAARAALLPVGHRASGPRHVGRGDTAVCDGIELQRGPFTALAPAGAGLDGGGGLGADARRCPLHDGVPGRGWRRPVGDRAPNPLGARLALAGGRLCRRSSLRGAQRADRQHRHRHPGDRGGVVCRHARGPLPVDGAGRAAPRRQLCFGAASLRVADRGRPRGCLGDACRALEAALSRSDDVSHRASFCRAPRVALQSSPLPAADAAAAPGDPRRIRRAPLGHRVAPPRRRRGVGGRSRDSAISATGGR